MNGIKVITKKLLGVNVLPLKALRSYAGKNSHVATIVDMFRPFLQDLWAAVASAAKGDSNAPPHCIWQVQAAHALRWMHAFLTRLRGKLERTFNVYSYMSMGLAILIYTDYSPWGLGAVLLIENKITS